MNQKANVCSIHLREGLPTTLLHSFLTLAFISGLVLMPPEVLNRFSIDYGLGQSWRDHLRRSQSVAFSKCAVCGIPQTVAHLFFSCLINELEKEQVRGAPSISGTTPSSQQKVWGRAQQKFIQCELSGSAKFLARNKTGLCTSTCYISPPSSSYLITFFLFHSDVFSSLYPISRAEQPVWMMPPS